MSLIVGAVTLLTPIPTGVFLIATGLALLASTSRRVAGWARGLRARFPGMDARLRAVEPRLPRLLKHPFRRTRPRRRRGEAPLQGGGDT